jgi:ABC-type multidrug transport system ATPase subunit/pSer/pThr/pTyr-binding forkhead associated (FHA) protein
MSFPVFGVAAPNVHTVGRAADNSCILDDPEISRYHLRITEVPEGLLVEDLGSRNGSYFNGKRFEHLVLQPSEAVYLGKVRFPLSSLGASSSFAPRLSKISSLKVESLTIGRSKTNDVCLPFPRVSSAHARIERNGNGDWIIHDLKSTNGTYVNGARVSEKVLCSGDRVAIATYSWDWEEGLNNLAKIEFQSGLGVETSKISVIKSRRTLLDEVSLSIDASTFAAIIGPSGSGKTTLLDILRGVAQPDRGEVFVGGYGLSSHLFHLLGQIGYVPQDDIIHRELTVFESLYYASKLRLPDDTSESELRDRVLTVLRDLRLDHLQSSYIGTPERRGISGGERKRVNVAQELITAPPLLLLDEPTSGLDPQGNIEVMRILRGLSDKGKTVILTTHSLSAEVFDLIDTVAVLDAGKLVYSGPPKNALAFFGVSNAADIFGILKDAAPGALKKKFLQSPDYVSGELRLDRIKGQSEASSEAAPGASGNFRQLRTLVSRYITRKIRDRTNAAVILLQAPVIGFLMGLVLQEDATRVNVLFLMVIASIWFGCSNAAREIVGEKAIFIRERMVSLKILPYLASKFIVLAGISALQCALLIGTVSLFISLGGSLGRLFLVLFLSACGGIGLGLWLSSLVNSSEAAVAMTPLVLIPQILMAGIIRPITVMNNTAEFAAGTMLSRWGSEALIGLIQPDLLPNFFNISAPQTGTDAAILVQIAVVFFVFAALCLRRLDPFYRSWLSTLKKGTS